MKRKKYIVIILGCFIIGIMVLSVYSMNKRTTEKGGESPEQAFLLNFPKAKVQSEFEYCDQHCVLGADNEGPIAVITEKRADGLYYIMSNLPRNLLSVNQNVLGNQTVVFFRNPNSQQEEKEIVVIWKYGNNSTPCDTNNAVYHKIPMLNDMNSIDIVTGNDHGEWYAITDVDQQGFAIT